MLSNDTGVLAPLRTLHSGGRAPLLPCQSPPTAECIVKSGRRVENLH